MLRSPSCLVLLSLSLSLVLAIPKAARADIIDQEFNIPLNNGTLGVPRNVADRLFEQGIVQEQQGALEQAINSWLQALEIYHRIGDTEAQAQTYSYLGLTYAKLGRSTEAEDALRRRVAIARDNQDFQGQIYGLNNVGAYLLRRQAAPQADRAFADALQMARDVTDRPGQSVSLSNLSLAATGMGNDQLAMRLSESAIALRQGGTDRLSEVNTLNNAGDTYRRSQRYSEAIVAYNNALYLLQRRENFSQQAQSELTNQEFRSLEGLVAVYRSSKQYPRTFTSLKRWLSFAQAQGDSRQELAALQALANLYDVVGDYPSAKNFYTQAQRLAQTMEEVPASSIPLTRPQPQR